MSGSEDIFLRDIIASEEEKEESENNSIEDQLYHVPDLEPVANAVATTAPVCSIAAPRQVSSPGTCRDVNTVQWPGRNGFQILFPPPPITRTTRTTEYSAELNKLYVVMDKWVEVRVVFKEDPPGSTFIRAMPVFAEATDSAIPVKRCPHHAQPEDVSNNGFPFPQHLIRFDTADAVYCEDLESGRLSVIAPYSASILVKFLCLGSCAGGLARRPLLVVFTAEEGRDTVLGREVVRVRVCSCPGRDRRSEEARVERQREGEHR